MRRTLVLALVFSFTLLAGVSLAEPVHFKELISVITVKVPGWKAGDPQGQTMKSPFEASVATQEFTNGDQVLEVAIYDGGPQYAAAISAIGQMDMETSEQTVKSLTVKGFKAMLSVGHKEQVADLLVAVGNRFVVGLNLTGSVDAKLLETVAAQMDLARLATLAK